MSIDLIFWGEIYFAVGLVSMLLLDLMHYATKDVQSESEYSKNAFTNIERLYVIVVWPIVLTSFIFQLAKVKND
jgi:hypothetical protein